MSSSARHRSGRFDVGTLGYIQQEGLLRSPRSEFLCRGTRRRARGVHIKNSETSRSARPAPAISPSSHGWLRGRVGVRLHPLALPPGTATAHRHRAPGTRARPLRLRLSEKIDSGLAKD
eukprot:5071556-Prymnesium_polylepis.1